MVAYQDEVTITGPPVVAGGQYWYPIFFEGTEGYLAAGTGGQPWLIAASEPSPQPTARPAAALNSVAPTVAANPQPGQPVFPIAVLLAAAVGTLLIGSVGWWALRGGAEPEDSEAAGIDDAGGLS